MLVAVRVRPLTQKEMAVDPNETVRVLDNKMIVLLDSSGEESEKRGRSREAQFSFDFVYDRVSPSLLRVQQPSKYTINRCRQCSMAFWKVSTPPSSRTEPQDAAKHTRKNSNI